MPPPIRRPTERASDNILEAVRLEGAEPVEGCLNDAQPFLVQAEHSQGTNWVRRQRHEQDAFWHPQGAVRLRIHGHM